MDQGNGTPARYLECMEWFLAPYPIGGGQGDPLQGSRYYELTHGAAHLPKVVRSILCKRLWKRKQPPAL